MATKMITFRCAPEILARITDLAKAQGKTRTRIITEAVRLFAHTVKSRGGRVVPPYDKNICLEDIDFDNLNDKSATSKE
ncbi:MAG: hypothetical protein IKC90_00220 [Akkermansia sp.]|nr:hypothetical protein [Akkermansia sp.]MBR3695526.1 hypothetical protein [Akkermansia sp.]MBR7108437.1 hypothetical protein [Akkermansia sp.]